MQHQILIRNTFFYLIILFIQRPIQAQQQNCVFKDPILKINFGTGNDIPAINIFPPPNYNLVKDICPNDGNYSFISSTHDCFNGDWMTFNEDHTPGDADGKMMVVNASPEGGVFFNTIISGLQGNKIYEFSAWMVNVCRISGGCPPLPPNITIKLLTTTGQIIASFQTGLLTQNATPHWRVYSGLFSTPADVTTLILTMEDITTGGCGNDFALDDITLRECVKPTPVVEPEIKPEVKAIDPPVVETKKPAKQEEKKLPPVAKPVEKTVKPDNKPVEIKSPVKSSTPKDTSVATIKKQVILTPENSKPAIKEKPVVLPAPKPISTRANPLIKQIETEAGEMEIDLYDNGEIDGDTVSVYHNNELIVSRAGLSAKPIIFHIKVDESHPYHEIIMVANNLGSIPPNTSMMIVTTKDKRYEVFISSSEQKNAKIVFTLKE